MSKKRNRGRGGRPTSDHNGAGAIRKQKAAKYADRNLKTSTSDNSPLGNSESEEVLDGTQLDNFTDKTDSGKPKSRKRYSGNNALTDDMSEPQGERRQKKAAAIRQAAEKSISESRTADSNTADEENSDGISESDRDKNAKRMKKAEYIKQETEMLIAADMAEPTDEECSDNVSDKQDETEDIPEDSSISEADNLPSFDNSELKEAFVKKYAAEQFEKSRNSKSNIPKDFVLEAAKDTADFVSAVQSGDATKVVALPAKKIIERKFGENKTYRNAKVVSSAVKNADSVGGAAAGIGTAIAADKVKQYINGLIFGRPDKKHKKREVKKYRHIKRKNTENNKAEQAAKKQRYKVKSVEKNAAAKKNLQRKFYIKSNKDVLPYVPKANIVQSIKKKLFAKLIAIAAPMIAPVFILLIVLMIISSMFSWLKPFKFIFAGSNDETSAEASDEILDVYTLMIQNYMDIAQANYYLKYGDWYGGTYDYPSADESLSFADFYASKCEYIIASIRAQYEDALANAQTEQERANISRAMGEAISNALREAQEGAAEEYQALIDGLNDCMTAEENRQHYEVKNNGGANGVIDTAEFNEKPIVGTNFFDNVEIESDLSAEELLAMTALYKSLKLIQTNGETEDGSEYDYNITPEDIMTFFEDTEYIPITAEITHSNTCAGQNCRRRLVGDYESGYSWEYYCLADHDNLNGSIDPCISRDELLEKIIELTEAEENGFDSEQCEEMIDEYIKTIKDELDIDEDDYRQFGASDNERAKEFYEILIDPAQGEIANNCWEIPTPVVGEESEDNSNE